MAVLKSIFQKSFQRKLASNFSLHNYSVNILVVMLYNNNTHLAVGHFCWKIIFKHGTSALSECWESKIQKYRFTKFVKILRLFKISFRCSFVTKIDESRNQDRAMRKIPDWHVMRLSQSKYSILQEVACVINEIVY